MRTSLVVVALAATTSLAACGGDDDKNPTPTPAATTTAVAPTTTTQSVDPSAVDPKDAAWAKEFCGALQANMTQITPPNVQASTPEGTKTSLVTFFTAVVDQQKAQITAMRKVGPPPGASAKKSWTKAQRKLRKVRSSVGDLVSGLKSQDPKSSADVQKLVTNLGKQMQAFGNYPGPIQDLAKNKSIAPALQAEPTCKLTT